MRVKISFTHGFNLFQQILVYPLALAGGILPAIAIAESDVSNTFIQIMSFIVWIAGTAGVGIGMNTLLDPLATMLYLFFSCKTKVSYSEAKKVAFLFNGNLGGKWYPFYSLEDVPEEYRKQILFEFAEKKKNGNFYFQEKFEPKEDANRQEQKDGDKKENSRTQTYQTYSSQYKVACSIIGIREGHSKEELKACYRKQMMKYHPDLYANSDQEIKSFAEEKAMLINGAYEYLISYNRSA